ncbi:hypothetical protein GCM10011344_42000 [Dokdonia pacifica]|uniref:Thioredoxin n=1 Tax=Dokdonia pacifica TaxID=1627892 RepID=A0A239DJV9_9FLAO|nr:vitamin K epoxide reductase family protein [Dokdonia pacifica]GGG36773.1 hypothetical protein GCM10011344_42000 [Dokdonia pacifica]SNS32499.1 Thioredoxin [Dokdonia pacifica]
MDELVFRFLVQSKITSLAKEDIHLQLLSHADYPSINAITDTLDYFGIENIAANVPKDALQQLPKLFLALIETGKNTELVLVTQLQKGIRVRTLQNKKKIRSIEKFSSQWTGTIIAIEQEEKKGSFITRQSSFKTIITTSILLSIIVMALLFTTSISHAVYTFLTVIGSVVSYLIYKESTGVKDTVTSKVCAIVSLKVDSCSAVITSKEGRISKNVGLGDASLLYFTSLFFVITLVGVHTSTLFTIAIGSLFVVAYSLYLQGIQLKQWCGLCLLISVVLISQFVTLFIAFSNWDFSLLYVIKGLVVSMTLTLLWFYSKPLLQKNKELLKTKKEYLSFKRNDAFFLNALQQDSIENLKHLPQEAQVYFGNRDAPIQITAYTNPLCGYCVAAFELYDRLLMQFPTDVGIQFIFNTSKDLENPSTQIAKRVLELYHKSVSDAFSALKDWFAHRDVDRWIEKYGIPNSMLLMDDRILEMHRDVAHQNDIRYTPETLIGNQKFPNKYYTYEDLFLFVETLKENAPIEIKHQMNSNKNKKSPVVTRL